MSYLTHPHIKHLIAENSVQVATTQLMKSIREAVAALPWHPSGTRIAWAELGKPISVACYATDRILANTVLGQAPYLLLYFAQDMAVVGTNSIILEELDELTRRAPGQRLILGVSKGKKLAPDIFGMYDGIETIETLERDHGG